MTEKIFAPELFRPTVDFPEAPYDSLVRASAERVPEKPAIVYQNMIFTYREVVSMINSIANGLYNLGLRKGDRICLYMTNRPEYTITFVAAASIGLVVSPMNPGYKEREISYQIENSEAKAIVIQRDMLPVLEKAMSQKSFPHLEHVIVTGATVPETMPKAITWASILRSSPPTLPPHVDIDPDDLVALPYSSGTTGLPKGTMLTHRNLTVNNLQFITALRPTSADVALNFLPFYHIYGVMLTGGFLACGGTQVIMERFDLLQSLDLCEQYGVTYYFAVPPIILALANAPVDLSKLKTVKFIFSGAAPLPPDPAKKLNQKTGVTVVQGYGLTEASPLTHAQPFPVMRLESVGLPVHNTEQRVVDIEAGTRDLPVGEDGEIIIRGPQVMKGYWKAPEETARALRDGWLYTGDIGHVDEDGFTYIVDRKKEMIKYKGFGVAPAEIEALLLEHPAIMDSAVIGVPDEEAGELIKGFVVPRPGHDATPDDIIAFANGKLAGYKRVHAIEFIDVVPKNASGKILRRELKERERERMAREK